MSAIETIPPQTCGESKLAGTWSESLGALWFQADDIKIREVAAAMNSVRARFVTITAHQLPGSQGMRLDYHWDLEGRLLAFAFLISGNSIESIYDLCEAADWIEREVHEQFAVEFTGRAYEPLLLRPGNAVGVYLREEAKK
ncbi:MAG TPA: NADH-quinone oxidoreductase subunit C [Terracidiphilus sp.]|nr:NADH-quinone oxidoreductase subunit C [Terracidiphilus sp.]